MHHRTTPILGSILRAARCALAPAIALAFSGAASAQENLASPPEALQFPFQAQASATSDLSMMTVRRAIEQSVDLILCETLMRRANRPLPQGRPFVMQDCESAFAQQVAANSGDVRWASSGARPSRCGQSCFGHPTMTAQDERTRPNLRRAHVFAWVYLEAGPRAVSYPLDVYFTCKAANGALDGDLVIEAKAGPPAIGDPGFLESFGSFFTAGHLSGYIESEIRRQLPSVSPRRDSVGRCRSVGVQPDANITLDLVKFDLPGARPRAPRVVATSVASTGMQRDQVRIEFLRIVRKPLPIGVDEAHGSPGSTESGQFTVFLNGASHFFPPQGLVLPVSGGAAPINFCTTLDITDWNRLQILFTNDLGGAVWSQFPRAQGFGQALVRTLTTSRTILVPGRRLPGQTGPVHPEQRVLNEFELTYRVTFLPRPSLTAQTTEPSRPGRPGLASVGALGTRPQLVDANAPTPTPCRQI